MPMPLMESPPARLTGARSVSLRLTGPVPNELAVGLEEIRRAFPGRFSSSPGATGLRFRALPPHERRLAISQEEEGDFVIAFSRPAEAFRALGVLMGRLETGLASPVLAQTAAFESLGVMLDVSRNGVLRPDSVRKLIRHLALMGVNQLMLYTEDTYEIPGEPLFGYFRGGYKREELTGFDDYAALFGIEVVPCIQTLGHLEQVLQWPPYQKFQDTAGVLLADDPAANAFVEKMIAAASVPFRSRRIHIGMDEAHGIGSGHYRLRNGQRPPFEILTNHLETTTATCRRLGLSPMIWSDMFFRLGSKTNHYYDRASVIAPEVAARVPKDVDLVYWDYYHTDVAFYDEWIDRHRAMGKEPVFAGGIWTWNRWWAQLPHSIATLRAGMTSARGRGLREAFVTMWGDDGMECDVFSALPALQYFAELGYGEAEEADANLSAHLRGSCAATAAAWVTASDLDVVPDQGDTEFDHANPAKWLLWHDPLLGFFDQHIPASFPAHYATLAERCADWSRRGTEDKRLDYVGHVAAVLALKTDLHLALRPAYRDGDVATLRRLADRTIPELRAAVVTLFAAHETRWHEIYRPFGWEVIERRYAGLLSRLDTLARKLAAHLSPAATPIAELALETHRVWPEKHLFATTLTHQQAVSPTRIF